MKLIITGKSASGKDYLKKKFLSRGFKQAVSYTTRPPRKGEINGLDYNFIDEDTFKEMIKYNDFREWNIFGPKKWYYGITVRDFRDSNLFIMTPSGIKILSASERKECFVIFLDVPHDVRKSRLEKRKDINADLEARMKLDQKDFKNFKDYDLLVSNQNF